MPRGTPTLTYLATVLIACGGQHQHTTTAPPDRTPASLPQLGVVDLNHGEPASPAWAPRLLIVEAISESLACARKQDIDLAGAFLLGANFHELDRDARSAGTIVGAKLQPRERHWSLTWKHDVGGYGLVVHFINVFEDGRCTIEGAEG